MQPFPYYTVSATFEDWRILWREYYDRAEALAPDEFGEDEEDYEYSFLNNYATWIGDLIKLSSVSSSQKLSTIVSDTGKELLETLIQEESLPVSLTFVQTGIYTPPLSFQDLVRSQREAEKIN